MHPIGQLVSFIWRSTKRAVIMVVGLVLVVGGLVMLVTPGPGLVLIIAGLAVLATEFVWAERMLDKAKEQAANATDKVPGGTRLKAAAANLLPGRRRRPVEVPGMEPATAESATGPTG